VDDVNDAIAINVRLTKANYNRMWEIKVSARRGRDNAGNDNGDVVRAQITQIEFAERAPAGCLQYFQGVAGTVQTMNFAVNGRHLADQDYVICMRQEQSERGTSRPGLVNLVFFFHVLV